MQYHCLLSLFWWHRLHCWSVRLITWLLLEYFTALSSRLFHQVCKMNFISYDHVVLSIEVNFRIPCFSWTGSSILLSALLIIVWAESFFRFNPHSCLSNKAAWRIVSTRLFIRLSLFDNSSEIVRFLYQQLLFHSSEHLPQAKWLPVAFWIRVSCCWWNQIWFRSVFSDATEFLLKKKCSCDNQRKRLLPIIEPRDLLENDAALMRYNDYEKLFPWQVFVASAWSNEWYDVVRTIDLYQYNT